MLIVKLSYYEETRYFKPDIFQKFIQFNLMCSHKTKSGKKKIFKSNLTFDRKTIKNG